MANVVMAERIAIVVFSGTVDKLTAAATIATGGVAMGMDVDLFFTYWGLVALRKDMIQGNRKISKEFEEMGQMMAEMMQKKNVPSWFEIFKRAREAGNVKLHACSQTYDLMGMKRDDLTELVDDVIGVGKFIELATDAKISLFI
ncbi:MAG: DsrE/DsrF/DrsH-like family protein [Nitrososphaerota archaeon]|nr:DsrE/DsrF/DrsH-like family protein [Nitrososphaerota archaeon]